MQDNTVPDETIELPVTEHDEADIIKMFGSEAEQPEHRTILEVWREVLAPADTERNGKVAPQWAINMVTAHVGVTFADMNDFRDEYFDKIIVLFNILLEEIATDEECLLRNSVQDDLIFNGQHYKNLLTNWQLQFMRWELEWDVVAPGAAVTLGVLAEVHKMFFGQMGLIPHLSSINFDEAYTEADQLALTEALQALKEGSSE
jgi:hypothetical protein